VNVLLLIDRLIDPAFFYFVCQSDFYWCHIFGEQIQATIQNVSAERYSELIVPCPPPVEQTAVTAFLLTAVFGLLWANAGSEAMVLAIGFGMIFFIQLAGNSSQIFISEVFPTNARASGFGLCQAAGRVGAFVAIPSFLWIQQGFGLTAVFVVIAVIVAIAAVAVTQIGPEAKGLALDEIAPPTA